MVQPLFEKSESIYFFERVKIGKTKWIVPMFYCLRAEKLHDTIANGALSLGTAINLRIDELILREKDDAIIVFNRKTSKTQRCRFIVHRPDSAGGFYKNSFYTKCSHRLPGPNNSPMCHIFIAKGAIRFIYAKEMGEVEPPYPVKARDLSSFTISCSSTMGELLPK